MAIRTRPKMKDGLFVAEGKPFTKWHWLRFSLVCIVAGPLCLAGMLLCASVVGAPIGLIVLIPSGWAFVKTMPYPDLTGDPGFLLWPWNYALDPEKYNRLFHAGRNTRNPNKPRGTSEPDLYDWEKP